MITNRAVSTHVVHCILNFILNVPVLIIRMFSVHLKTSNRIKYAYTEASTVLPSASVAISIRPWHLCEMEAR